MRVTPSLTTSKPNAQATSANRPRHYSWPRPRSGPGGPGGRLSPRSINTIVGEVGRIHDAETTDHGRHLGTLRPHDLRHTFGYRLSEASGHNRAELERRLGHANDRYLRLYTNPPDDIAASYVEHL